MKIKNFEKGQAIVIIALSMIGLIAMAALIIDGSNSYLNRRRAQTAADAAAMAGARELCLGHGTEAEVEEVAVEYATIQNHATAVDDFFIDNGVINVTVSLTADTFFAKVFNKPTATVNAKAAAGCFSPAGGKGMLPVAWACKDIEGGLNWDSPDCEYKALEYDTELKPLLEPGHEVATAPDGILVPTPFDFETYWLPEIYVIMDTESLPDGSICFDPNDPLGPGIMDCDFDDDGKDDFLGKGDATWLDLNGEGGGSDELVDWVRDGYNEGTIRVHTWIPSEPGDNVNIFHEAAKQVGKIVLLPIFNQFCPDDPELFENQYCSDAAHTLFPLSPPDISSDIFVSGTANTYYHIVGFGFFFISCVDAPAEQDCPGHDLAVANGLIDKQINTIEGYFVTGVPADFGSAGGTGGVDLGAYILSLTQ